ncbi:MULTISPECIES: hypothetical protein [Roseomonadaceae]|uniref:Uncharacterized protein n=1 Tax=Falsiroseomonas oleicola TaxID=2801474 RepID=A0ABS6H7V7_9PROT|nr:hypothetical protein [Roseomonas oleicola]MBU8544786.1 hypothetical protein [Roseomonas oleicola]
MSDIEPRADGAALPPDVLTTDEAEGEKRHRRFMGRRDLDQDPKVRFTMERGGRVAHVALSGRHGMGKEMQMDAEDWHRVAEEYGRGWALVPGASGRFDVCSGRTALASLTGQSGGTPRANLSRLMMDARPDQVVTFVDRDKLNLRRNNLQVVGRKDWLRAIRTDRKAH